MNFALIGNILTKVAVSALGFLGYDLSIDTNAQITAFIVGIIGAGQAGYSVFKAVKASKKKK